ncbi:SpaH/EbpB family LPXTG-anchored major pilin [Macrococcoides canis]|uniref:SpaH/EbpB family LPXTG-anchored major pilin n=1 Tax=Macrococcoides canis TaxID=1855823 RepID=UPI0020B8C295|nr:SpaH/EbpB family LPXTG-anchored major pilin [Macrococcus canis]UTH07367.1 SpaH/EbpB family LPXTG-anchored major pilin [Macrococcus canis]
MSNFKNKVSIFLTMALIFAFILPFNANAAGPATNLTIHKITGDTARPSTNGELTGTETPAGDPIANISFTYWKVTADQLATMRATPGNYTTAEQVQTYVGSAATGTTGKTAADGTVQVTGLEEGYYWFIEDESSAVRTSAAVPFGLDLPLSNNDGTGYITDLHVYPKNTLEATPTIDKDVVSDGQKSATFNIGDSFNWIIQPTTPKGLDEYTKFTVTDTLSSALTYDSAAGVTVTAGGQTLIAGTDYNANYDGGTHVVTVDFTTAGLEKIAGIGIDTKLNINVATKINETATMGVNIPNTATLTFDNGHGTTGTATVAQIDVPEVHTGGKNFVKTDGNTTNLQGAQFKIENSAGQYLIQDSATLAVTWGTKDNGTVFTSGTDGTFFVKGLAYGDYTLEEIKAPAGYTLPTNPESAFTVDQDSFNSANTQTIINKKTVLPDTGGAGTILFTVIGLALMALAVLLLRKKNEA